MNDIQTPPPGNKLSHIGLGCVTFGREIDPKTSFMLMDLARSRGINYFDTAAAYGAGASEAIVGEWLAARPEFADSIMISTKILPPYTAEAIRQSVEQSLMRLQVPTIDILYLHRWEPEVASGPALETLHGLVQEGKIGMLGASNFTAAQLGSALQEQSQRALTRFAVIQNNHNLAVSDVDEAVRKLCQEYGVSIVTYSPLGAGFLTGKYRKGIEAGTRFSRIPGHQDVYFHEQAFSRLERLLAVSVRTGYSAAFLAMAWALHQPGIASVLVGGRSADHLELAFSALAFDDPEIFSELSV